MSYSDSQKNDSTRSDLKSMNKGFLKKEKIEFCHLRVPFCSFRLQLLYLILLQVGESLLCISVQSSKGIDKNKE